MANCGSPGRPMVTKICREALDITTNTLASIPDNFKKINFCHFILLFYDFRRKYFVTTVLKELRG